MIKIIKGSKTLTVPLGAYEEIYAPNGWELMSKENKLVETEMPEEPEEPEGELPEESEEEPEEEDVEYVDPEELLEKPLEELDFEELKIVAEYLDISTKGLKSKKEVREAIKAHRK